MRFRLQTLACGVAVLVGSSSAYGQDATLRYQWVNGDEVRYRISRQGITTVSGLPGIGEITIEQSDVQVIRLTVEEVATNGNATLRQTFESVRVELSSPMGDAVVDSAAGAKPTDPTAAAMGTTMSALIGESITIVMMPTGGVLKVEGMSRIVDKVMKTLPQDSAGAQVLGQLKATMSDDAIRSQLEQGFVLFPDHGIKAGESWTGQFQVSQPMIGTLTVAKSSTLKSIETSNGTSTARIAVTLAMKQEAAAAVTSGLLGMTLNFADTTGEGEILFDITKGRVQQTSFTSDMPAKMSTKAPDGSLISAEIRARNVMTMEIVEK